MLRVNRLLIVVALAVLLPGACQLVVLVLPLPIEGRCSRLGRTEASGATDSLI